MLRAHFIVKGIAVLSLLYSFYYVTSQRAFEHFLDTLNITFDDFPVEYAKALNESVAQKQQPEGFDYASVFKHNQIPRIIHYIWFKDLYPTREGATKIPSDGSHAPELCRKFNPDYEIRMWNATSAREFLEADYAWFIPTYDSYKYPIQKIDALKYFALYHYGGVYMDLDIACRRALDPLLDFPAWFPEASPLGVNNDLMASAARHPILKRMTERLIAYNRNWLFPYITIFWTTGPHFTSDILEEWYRSSDRPQVIDGSKKKEAGPDVFFVLPRIFYSEEYTFFGHSPGGTWHGSDVATVLWFVDHPAVSFGILFLLVGAIAGLLYRRARQGRSSYTALPTRTRSSSETARAWE
ncbi:hypothetical protein J1614_010380 [Plenodomus biglobosus]|nr:hypothetical protein J1614_010380 [Plenodomus biglobosus]